MRLSWKTYCLLAAVWAGSATMTLILRSTGLLELFVATPGALALIGALYKLLLDEAAHMKTLAVQHDQQRFALGITSHMADVAFDKHVALCEDFTRELFETLQALMNNPLDHEGAKRCADALGDTIRKHAIWISPELQVQLEEFENAVRQIAAQALIAVEHPQIGDRQKLLGMLLELIDSGASYGKTPRRELLYRKIIDHTRQVLGVQELTQLRHSILQLQRKSGSAG